MKCGDIKFVLNNNDSHSRNLAVLVNDCSTQEIYIKFELTQGYHLAHFLLLVTKVMIGLFNTGVELIFLSGFKVGS